MKYLNTLFIGFFLIGIIYILYPASSFPPPPINTIVSTEPSDTESIYRKSFFTNLSREEIMAYYKQSFPQSQRLNHPPEDAFMLIRDQTRSSWLEELSRPFKNTLYINGFYPTKATEQIYRNGNHYNAKITIRYIPYNVVTSMTVWCLAVLATYLLIKEYVKK